MQIETYTDYVRTLAMECGSRHCGSAGEAKATDFLEKTFKELGCAARRESFPVRGWHFRSFSFWNVTENRPVPDASAEYFSFSVHAVGKLLWIEVGQEQKLETLPVKDRICMVMRWDGNVFEKNRIAETLETLGAAAAVFVSTGHTDLAPSTKLVRSPFLHRIATAAVSLRGAVDLLKHRDDTYRLVIDAESVHTEDCNIIRCLGHGPNKAIIGGHYDTAPLVEGACDNASGTAALLMLAEHFKAEEAAFAEDWTLEFAAFGGEEYIASDYQMGSHAYVESHKTEPIRWYFNIDDVGQPYGIPFVSVTREERLPQLVSAYPIGSKPMSSDNLPFHDAGFPTVTILDLKPWMHIHTALDNMEHFDPAHGLVLVEECARLLEQLLRGTKETRGTRLF